MRKSFLRSTKLFFQLSKTNYPIFSDKLQTKFLLKWIFLILGWKFFIDKVLLNFTWVALQNDAHDNAIFSHSRCVLLCSKAQMNNKTALKSVEKYTDSDQNWLSHFTYSQNC